MMTGVLEQDSGGGGGAVGLRAIRSKLRHQVPRMPLSSQPGTCKTVRAVSFSEKSLTLVKLLPLRWAAA